MARAFLVVMDSVGCGGAPDAAAFGDDGANTLLHIAEACVAGQAEDGRSGPLRMPHLDQLGLGAAIHLACGERAPALGAEPKGVWGAATEVSPGKDTPSGHWELAGVPVPWDWHVFPDTEPCFPDAVVRAVAQAAGTDGILGNRHASGTLIIDNEGAAHLRTGWPICYTSVDSVFQIAAHETAFGLQRLYDLCRAVAPLLHDMRIGRVIARPFVGEPGAFRRTPRRRDYAIAPPSPTLLDWAHDAGREVHAIGKIGDIFSMRGIAGSDKGEDAKLMDDLERRIGTAPQGSLTMANFVEFDTDYGHLRDVAGYARALEWFDAQVPRLTDRAGPGDLILFTADHGNDPTWHGTDHTRERVPVLIHGRGAGRLGQIAFADIAATIAAHLGIEPEGPGRSAL